MDPTATRQLGTSGVQVTRLGLGLAPIAGLYTPVSQAQATATIDRAWEHGLRLFDTAPLYGLGRSEERAGAALVVRPRDEYVLCTKVGRVLVPGAHVDDDMWADPPAGVAAEWDFSYDGVLRSVVDSKRRLGLDRVDVLHLHDPEEHYATAVEGGLRALHDLRDAGEIRAVSVGTTRVDRLTDYARDGDLDCLMVAGRYTLLDQSALATALPMCAAQGVAVLAAGVYNSGLLADTKDARWFNYREAAGPLVDQALAAQEICSRHGVPLRAAAIQFPTGHPAVTSVVVGARSPAEVDDAVAAFRHEIPPVLWVDLKSAGLLPEAAPCPVHDEVRGG